MFYNILNTLIVASLMVISSCNKDDKKDKQPPKLKPNGFVYECNGSTFENGGSCEDYGEVRECRRRQAESQCPGGQYRLVTTGTVKCGCPLEDNDGPADDPFGDEDPSFVIDSDECSSKAEGYYVCASTTNPTTIDYDIFQ